MTAQKSPLTLIWSVIVSVALNTYTVTSATSSPSNNMLMFEEAEMPLVLSWLIVFMYFFI